MPLVGVVIGSRSDESMIQDTLKVLEELGVSHELSVISAHRSPEKARDYAKAALGRGVEVIIAAAGGSAALPGVLALVRLGLRQWSRGPGCMHSVSVF